MQTSLDEAIAGFADVAPLGNSATKLPNSDIEELIKFRESDEGKKLTAWAQKQFTNCRSQRTEKQTEWALNVRMVSGQQWLKQLNIQGHTGFVPQRAPSYSKRRTINLLRSFVRTECSKFQSTFPTIVSVPATAEEEDVRAAYAAEQAWEAMTTSKDIERTYARAIWWMVITGNGFLKQWWDPGCEDENGMPIGDIKFESVSPFHLFVPDLFEREMDNQPYIIQAQTRTIEWVRAFYPEELRGVDLNAEKQGDGGSMIDEAFRQIVRAPKQKDDTVTVYEYWVKKGATDLLPEGGLLVYVGDTLVAYHPEFPYKHNQLPYSKLEHLFNDTFYAESPLADLLELQKEYNETRSDIGMAVKRMGRPQMIAVDGSIVTSKMTNEPGSIIKVRPGFTLPQPMQLAALPQYVTDSQDRIRADFEDVSGQHEISRGEAPTGVSAGTALTFLKETDDAYLTPQYKNIEQAVQRTARQSLSLFNQYVDTERKLKVIGKDGSFDVLMLEGSDIASGLDVRIERGSAVGESQAAKQARVLEYFQYGLIDQPTAMRLLEVGGPQKLLDTQNIAARKAQRENLKMKALEVEIIEAKTEEFIQGTMQQISSNQETMMLMAQQGLTADDAIAAVRENVPAMIPVDDFDIHEVHLEEHNRYRMSQEFETLPDPVKEEFQKHCAMHEQYLQQAMAMQMMMQGGGGAPGGAPPGAEGEAPGPEPMPGSIGPDSPEA